MAYTPFNRWIAAVILMLIIYLSYGVGSRLLETDLTNAADIVGVSQYADEVIGNVIANYWYGILLSVGGAMLLLVIAGIPGQQEESRYDF